MKNSAEKLNSFDAYAANYDAALAKGISVSGEDKEYFAAGRIQWLARQLKALEHTPTSILDFGCGAGSATPYLLKLKGCSSILGVDTSTESLAIAELKHGAPNVRYMANAVYQPREEFELAFCNGVFHHIPLSERQAAVDYVYKAVRPGGIFSFWENNPWNPGTRYVMSRIPFDRDAITLSAPEARRMLTAGGFEVLRIDFAFIFPKLLSALRPLEQYLVRLPFGAQYQVLCRKPHSN